MTTKRKLSFDICEIKLNEVNMTVRNSNGITMITQWIDMNEIKATSDHRNIPRFMRHVKKVNPEKRCFLQYDKLYIDGKVFMFNETTGKVFYNGNTEKMMTIKIILRWRSK